MEYVQMTLNDWIEIKQKLKQELLGVKQSFVRIGYALRQIDDQKLYERDGYKSVAEFAKAEYGLEASTTSRFMSINREYSIDGYSERLRPEYADLGRSQLEEMLKLPDSDRQMIQPEASREDIRELKRFNKTEPEAGEADDLHQLVEKFYQDNSEVLNAVFSEAAGFDEATIGKFTEIVNPGGNRSYKKGLYFLMMYENRVSVKKFGGTPKDMTWWEFYQMTLDIFEASAAGSKTWQNYFGTEEDVADQPQKEDVPEEHPEPINEKTETESEESLQTEEGAESNGTDIEAEQPEDETTGEEKGTGAYEEDADETIEPAGEESQREEIAPAQKEPKIQENQCLEASVPEGNDDEKEPIKEGIPEVEVVNEKYETRREHMSNLTIQELAHYLTGELGKYHLEEIAITTVKLDTAPPVIKSATITPNPVDCGKTFVISVEVTD